MEVVDNKKYYKKQRRLFVWTITAVLLFVVAWTAGIYRRFFGFDPYWADDNFAFNVAFLCPATIISLLILYFTGGLTIANWRQLPNKKISILTVFLSFSLIAYVAYYFIMLFRQH
ncbi:MAG: hypothetical protein ABI472_17025 [Ginsengibacter sp.]